MTVRQLILELENLQPNLEVEIHSPYDGGDYIEVSTVEVYKKIVGAFTKKIVRIS